MTLVCRRRFGNRFLRQRFQFVLIQQTASSGNTIQQTAVSNVWKKILRKHGGIFALKCIFVIIRSSVVTFFFRIVPSGVGLRRGGGDDTSCMYVAMIVRRRLRTL